MQVAATESKRSLFEKLQETYPIEDLQPYGQVVVIPSKMFRNEWKERLEAEGVKTYVTSHAGQACFFLRKVEQESATENAEPSVKTKKKPWTTEERLKLKKRYEEGVNIAQLSREFERSSFSIGAAISHFRNLPSGKRRYAKKSKERCQYEINIKDSDIVKEFLLAATALYDQGFKTTCKFVLAETIKELRRS